MVPVAGEPEPARHARAHAALRRHRHVVRVDTVHAHAKGLVAVTDRIWVGVVDGPRGRAALAAVRGRGGVVVQRHGSDHLIRLPAGVDPRRECAALARRAGVEYAEPDHVLVGHGFKSGRRRPTLRVQPSLDGIGLAQAWRRQPIDGGTVVALLDCGVDGRHPDLRGAITGSFDATGRGGATRPAPWDSHGTECAGLVAGRGRAGGVRGVAAGGGFLPIRIGYTPTRLGDYVTKVSWFVAGIEWAWRHGADVLSMSFGGGPRATPILKALARARTEGRQGKGCVLVAAVGNSGVDGVEFPASAPGVIGVAATDRNGKPAAFSNRGAAVDLAAPGVNVTTLTIPDPTEDEPSLLYTDSGTSLSTPVVAGVAALVIAADPSLRGDQVARLLADTATRRGPRSKRIGAGVVDAAAAVAAAQECRNRRG